MSLRLRQEVQELSWTWTGVIDNGELRIMITINNLKKQFGDTCACDIPSFTINNGEILGLVGNNGAGKTTLFRLLLDLLKADDGTVINEPYVYSKFLILKTDKDKDFYVVLNTPDGYSVLAEYSHEAERSLPIALAEDTKLRRLPILSGDADGNGRITANDAMKMMRYSIRLEDLTAEQLAASDVNNDGKVNAKDSLATLRFTIGYKDRGTVFAN